MSLRAPPGAAHLAWLFLAMAFVVGLSGCTSLFFQPTRTRYPYLELDRLNAETVKLKSRDGTLISAWRLSSVEARKKHPEIETPKDLKTDEVRGYALQFHGNAQNMTSHYRYQLWLLFEGWDVLTFDYRGYGDSGDSPGNLDGVRDDGIAALQWANGLSEKAKKPLIVFGQSLGANLLVSALENESLPRLRLLVFDSGFYSFTSIAREKLSDVWFLWPFQWLGWVLVSNDLSAGPRLKRATENNALFQTRAIFLHSENDPVVSNEQGLRLFESYPGPKERWTTPEPGHLNTLFAEPDESTPPKSKSRERLKKILRDISKDPVTQ